MAEENLWLPPRAPDAAEPPRFQSVPEQPPAAPAAAAAPAAPPVTFVQPQPGTGNGMAIAALVLSIAGLALLVLSLGLGFFLSLICSGTAWGLAVSARKRAASGRAVGGESQARAALIMGILGVALGVVAMVVWIYLIASGFDIEEWQRELQRDLERDGEFSAITAALRAIWP